MEKKIRTASAFLNMDISNMSQFVQGLAALVALASFIYGNVKGYIPDTTAILGGLLVLTALPLILAARKIINRPWHRQSLPRTLSLRRDGQSLKARLKTITINKNYEHGYLQPLESSSKKTSISSHAFETLSQKITVIVEDDPVGTISSKRKVLAIPVSELYSKEKIVNVIETHIEEICSAKLFFIPTPSRMLTPDTCKAMQTNIGLALKEIELKHQILFRIVSKIDSCLRSHYFEEYTGLSQGYGNFDKHFVAPEYVEQGRICCYGNVFVPIDGAGFTPLHKTEYSSFGGFEFNTSNIALWLQEKTAGEIRAKNVYLISIDKLRTVSAQKLDLEIGRIEPQSTAVVVDAVNIEDVTSVFNLILQIESTHGANNFYKLGPSLINKFVEALTVTSEVPPYEPSTKTGGLILSGSLTTITKRQIQKLRDTFGASTVLVTENDVSVNRFLINNIKRKSRKIEETLSTAVTIVTTELWKNTEIEYPSIASRDKYLDFFVNLLREIDLRPSWLLIKGSDTAMHAILYGLKIEYFYYVGHYISGVNTCLYYDTEDNVWKKFFIVGGNVGNENLLTDFFRRIQSENLG